jgi:cytochrome c oxidase subunit IV
MAETNLTHDQEMHVESHAPYLKVFFALLIFTIMEYFYAMLPISFPALVVGLLAMAITKATLVGWYFMHLKFEKPWVYFMIVPALILAAILTLALCPDMVLKFDESEDRAAEPETSNAQALSPRPTFNFTATLDS